MRLLLDTHTFLWLVEGSPNLSAAARIAIGWKTTNLTASQIFDRSYSLVNANADG